MAHMLAEVEGKKAFAYAGKPAWHREGVQVDGDATPMEMLKAAHLDWNVSKKQLSFTNAGGKKVNTDHYALMRDTDERVFDVVSKNWIPVQNEEAFGFFNKFHEMGDVKMDAAGALYDGSVVWGLAKMQSSFKVMRDDLVEDYILFVNPHRWARGIKVLYTSVRVVCNNTITMALREEKDRSKIFIGNHRTEFNAELVAETLGAARRASDDFKELAVHLSTKEYTDESAKEYLKQVFPHAISKAEDAPMSRPAQQAFDALDTQPGAELAGHTLWNLLNSVTYVTDNVLGKSDATRLSSTWDGINARRKAKAVTLIKEMAAEAA